MAVRARPAEPAAPAAAERRVRARGSARARPRAARERARDPRRRDRRARGRPRPDVAAQARGLPGRPRERGLGRPDDALPGRPPRDGRRLRGDRLSDRHPLRGVPHRGDRRRPHRPRAGRPAGARVRRAPDPRRRDGRPGAHHAADPRDGAAGGRRPARALPDGALVVNVSRGKVVDTDALVAELRTGRLSAALDVTDPEPLPVGHPLWTTPNTVLTPHVGGNTDLSVPRSIELMRRQVTALADGRPFENVIDR
ncbi:NAD(P)-dependent oxidoreductase [Curtobacterium flaccumfaciens]|nr:NAD(P)-dependent oxidoreductase [Curtobacterium flaccumfaciens]